MDLAEKIDVYEGFPIEGISFKDINSLIKDPQAYKEMVDLLVEKTKDLGATKVVSTESRGYILGCPLAYALGIGFVPVRKPGKLPGKVISESYDLEYGQDTVEIQESGIDPGDKVILVDDLLATGGTLKASADLVKKLGGDIKKVLTLIELTDLKGADKLKDYDYESIIQYPA